MYSPISYVLRGRLALVVGAALVLTFQGEIISAQTAPTAGAQAVPNQPAAPQAKPPARAPAPRAGAKPTPTPAPPISVAVAAPAAPASPPPQDLRFRTTYTTGGQKTESVTFLK